MNRKQLSSREKTVIESIMENKIVAIIRGVGETEIVKVVDALYQGGIKLVEVTFEQNDPNCDQSLQNKINCIKEAYPDSLMVGAGTVLSVQQVEVAASAGVDYIISPNTDVEVIAYSKKKELVSIPGAYTASEIVYAQQVGADFVKVFPSDIGGAAYIKAIRAPLSTSRLLAVGGVKETNLASFLDAGCVGVGLGGSLVNRNMVEEGRYDEIENIARRMVAQIQEWRLS